MTLRVSQRAAAATPPELTDFCSAALLSIFVDVTVRRELKTVLRRFKNDNAGREGELVCVKTPLVELKGGATVPLFL